MRLNSAMVKNIQAVSPVWFVPIIALAIALWLAVQSRMEQGTLIEIYFDSAHDIKADQTQIRLNNVQVGKVKALELTDDLKRVKVLAEIDRKIAGYLGQNTRFWVATPRVSVAEVSNLSTLISGVYIVMDPGEKNGFRTEFKGLDKPPAFESDEPGTHYVLQAETLGSLDVGSPIYYRQIRVGEVTAFRLNDARQRVDIDIFVRAPYDDLVRTSSRFWNVSGFGVTVNADGLKAQMASLVSLINGGISFDNAAAFKDVSQVDPGHRFYLYADRESVLAGRYTLKHYFLLKFSGSIRGLTVGAPVEFRGIKIGEVVEVSLSSAENKEGTLHVYIEIEPQRLQSEELPERKQFEQRLDKMIAQGLRAQMKTASLITGTQFIDLSFFSDLSEGQLVRRENYSEIPVFENASTGINGQFASLLEKLNRIPLESIGTDASESMRSLKHILQRFEQRDTAAKVDMAISGLDQTLVSASKVLEQVNATMASLDQSISPDSELSYELNEMLKSVADAAQALELFFNELNRHPNALIYGAEKDE